MGNPARPRPHPGDPPASTTHHFTLVCHDFAQLGQFVHRRATPLFRAVKAATPGRYTFILPATKRCRAGCCTRRSRPSGSGSRSTSSCRRCWTELGEPLLSSTLLLPGDDEPMTQGWEIKERLDHLVDAVIDSGDCGVEPTTVIDLSGPSPQVLRVGAGDPVAVSPDPPLTD